MNQLANEYINEKVVERIQSIDDCRHIACAKTIQLKVDYLVSCKFQTLIVNASLELEDTILDNKQYKSGWDSTIRH